MQLVATFSDIYLARRMVNRKSIGRNTLQYAMFNLVKEIRDTTVEGLREFLVNYLEQMDERINGITESSEGPFLLHGRNNNHTRYLLARITTYVEQQSGKQSNFHSFHPGVKASHLKLNTFGLTSTKTIRMSSLAKMSFNVYEAISVDWYSCRRAQTKATEVWATRKKSSTTSKRTCWHRLFIRRRT